MNGRSTGVHVPLGNRTRATLPDTISCIRTMKDKDDGGVVSRFAASGVFDMLSFDLYDLYEGREVPADLIVLQSDHFECPTTGKLFTHKNTRQVFLISHGRSDGSSV